MLVMALLLLLLLLLLPVLLLLLLLPVLVLDERAVVEALAKAAGDEGTDLAVASSSLAMKKCEKAEWVGKRPMGGVRGLNRSR